MLHLHQSGGVGLPAFPQSLKIGHSLAEYSCYQEAGALQQLPVSCLQWAAMWDILDTLL